MRALVLGGAGAIGRWVVRDLTESDGVEEVAVADLDLGRALEAAGWAAVRAGAHGTASVRALALDAAHGAALRQAIERIDVVCNCAGHATNLRVMQACADAGSHYVDLGGLFHTTPRSGVQPAAGPHRRRGHPRHGYWAHWRGGRRRGGRRRRAGGGRGRVRGAGARGAGASAIELGASVPASVAAQLLASKLIVERGVLPPELAIPPGPYFQELARRGITVSLTTRRLDPINGNRPNDR